MTILEMSRCDSKTIRRTGRSNSSSMEAINLVSKSASMSRTRKSGRGRMAMVPLSSQRMRWPRMVGKPQARHLNISASHPSW